MDPIQLPATLNNAITFPTTREAFIAYQEHLAGRKLTETEQEVIAAWVGCFNLSYEDGLRQDRAAFNKDIAKLDELIKKHTDDSILRKYLEVSRCWISYAWEQGQRHLKAIVVDG